MNVRATKEEMKKWRGGVSGKRRFIPIPRLSLQLPHLFRCSPCNRSLPKRHIRSSQMTAPIDSPPTGISTKQIKFSENEVIRAAMELHDPTIATISLRGKDYDVHVRSGDLRCVRIDINLVFCGWFLIFSDFDLRSSNATFSFFP